MSQRVVSFHYTLKDPQGNKVDSSIGGEPFSYIEGKGQIIPGLEKRMQPLKVKDKKSIPVPAAEAYGPHEPNLVVSVSKDKLPKPDVAVGDQFQVSGDPQGRPFLVVEVSSDTVKLDANHPLAGVDLTFDVEVLDIREATEEELAHGHAHGPGGHGH